MPIPLWQGKRAAVRACLILVFMVCAARGQSPEKFKPFRLKTLDGTPKELRDFANKVILVSFFFQGCPYCNAAFPELQKIYDRYKGKGLSMVWIHMSPEEGAKIVEWKAQHRYTVPILVGESQASLERDYHLELTPAHFLVGPQGDILFSSAGYTKGDEKVFEKAIQKALAP